MKQAKSATPMVHTKATQTKHMLKRHVSPTAKRLQNKQQLKNTIYMMMIIIRIVTKIKYIFKTNNTNALLFRQNYLEGLRNTSPSLELQLLEGTSLRQSVRRGGGKLLERNHEKTIDVCCVFRSFFFLGGGASSQNHRVLRVLRGTLALDKP